MATTMFARSAATPLDARTVGVLSRDDANVQPGYTLVCAGREVYLLDLEGRVAHEWRSQRNVFVAYLLPNGNLLRDGSENDVAVAFKAGGASGYVEEVTWDNEVVWSFSKLPYASFLTHHDLEPMPNGNVLLLCWQRKTKEEAIAAGRRPELIPDGEVWSNLTIEIAPDGKGSAEVVWVWDLWDHLVQDASEEKNNYHGENGVKEHPELFNINYCPPGGKSACRNADLLKPAGGGGGGNSHGWAVFSGKAGVTGEKDWIHMNAVSYDPERDQIVMSFNVPSELVLIDHSTSSAEAATHTGGTSGRGGDILWRWGNPQTYRHGTRMEQALFCQHSVTFIPEGCPGHGNILLFNNGRNPDRIWSDVLELELPEQTGGQYLREAGEPYGPVAPVWKHGPQAGRGGSFYCTHISGAQRLPNGNTLVTLGPLGCLVEVTSAGDEVWRWLNPALISNDGVSFVRQGDPRRGGRFSLFRALRYAEDYPAFAGRESTLAMTKERRYLEA